MLWSKPSWLSRDGKVGLEVIYSEEPPYREVTHLTTWKTDTMHTHDSFWPTGYKHERGQPWRGLGYCECVGGWGRGCEEPRLHFLHSHLFPVDTHVYTYPGPEVGTNNQKRVTLRVAFLNWFLSHAKSQSHPGSLILPLRFFSWGCSLHSHLFPHAWLPQHRTSGSLSQYLSCLRIRDLPSSLGLNTLSQISVACKCTACQVYFKLLLCKAQN